MGWNNCCICWYVNKIIWVGKNIEMRSRFFWINCLFCLNTLFDIHNTTMNSMINVIMVKGKPMQNLSILCKLIWQSFCQKQGVLEICGVLTPINMAAYIIKRHINSTHGGHTIPTNIFRIDWISYTMAFKTALMTIKLCFNRTPTVVIH